ncbi:putative TIM-barrel fold metal-dependent hydrolase [Altererythrobacter atlanticus]|uniref:4-sulfomuconolactone hydrolase n=1 Tax=Croceibacterium atlanticum TaxID=1267766 RepID=A0A0F7KRC1_9SPHN|nr:amidohydrolase family protein [Croceibacterium atlanticum]AKH42139.1 4-sulfomuconolactone hydrolase [Croceibacterium atlanticum]MBB5733290.1 putative TIM-barrel fold metal-dependent hydrolase [Croceibacterium atlanticum]
MASANEHDKEISGNPVIDCHAHIFTSDMPACVGAWTVPDYAFTGDDLLARMDAHGIHFAILSGLSISGEYNDYMIRALRRHNRLRGTAIVNPQADLYALEHMQADGITGIRLQLARRSTLPDFSSDEYRLLLRRLRDLDWHVQLAIEGPQLRPVLEPLMEAGVKVVIDHFGHPDPEGPLACDGFACMLEAIDTGRCWVKMSAGFRLPGTTAWQDDPDGNLDDIADLVAAELLRRVGTDRLLWGSDAPFVGYENRVTFESVLASYRRWLPDPAKRAEICRTGLKLYFS